WWRGGAAPEDVRIAFSRGACDINWHTAQASRGTVFHGPFEETGVPPADGMLDHPPALAKMARDSEESASTEHRVRLDGLRHGDRVVIGIATPSGASAWARVVLVPPEDAAHQVKGGDGTRVKAATGRVMKARLEAWS